MALSDELRDIAVELGRHLAWQQADGTRSLLREPVAKVESARRVDRKSDGNGPGPVQVERSRDRPGVGDFDQPGEAKAPAALPSGSLDEVRAHLGDCTRCKLSQGRTTLVFGAGNPKAELVFVGEAPGQEEDLQGLPFVGAAGQLLTKMIEAMKLTRDEVYICNVVKCRPPGNRNPEPDEIAQCEPFLKAQLGAIKPRYIVTLGKFAAQALLRDTTPISKLRGQWREYEGTPLMPTFHPAYLLRVPSEKKLAWLDLQQVMKRIGRV